MQSGNNYGSTPQQTMTEMKYIISNNIYRLLGIIMQALNRENNNSPCISIEYM